MELTFFPPCEVISQNEANRAAFGSRGRSIGLRKKLALWKEAAWATALAAGVRELGRSEVTVILPFRTAHRRDPHNYVGTVVKSIVDGLVTAGVWPDDNPEYVTVAEPVCYVAPKDSVLRCVVSIEPKEV
jgi:hypothetical protein